jgi:hypothetical protein
MHLRPDWGTVGVRASRCRRRTTSVGEGVGRSPSGARGRHLGRAPTTLDQPSTPTRQLTPAEYQLDVYRPRHSGGLDAATNVNQSLGRPLHLVNSAFIEYSIVGGCTTDSAGMPR